MVQGNIFFLLLGLLASLIIEIFHSAYMIIYQTMYLCATETTRLIAWFNLFIFLL
jgi:hypothetical protein